MLISRRAEKVDPNAGDGKQEVQWIMFYSGSRIHKEQANTRAHQEWENTTDDTTKTKLRTGIKYKLN